MRNNILEKLNINLKTDFNNPVKIDLGNNLIMNFYPKSISEKDNCVFIIGKEKYEKYLFIVFDNIENQTLKIFEGNILTEQKIKKCPLTTNNRKALQQIFNFTVPKPLGLTNTIGMGDRIGLANAGHIRSLKGSNFKPVLAQQSIRELTRTNRTPDEVLDAAVWAVFQEGYKEGFGADADHLKTTENIDMLIKAGFKMFTFDPGDHVDNFADSYSANLLIQKAESLPWDELKDSLQSAKERYSKDIIKISDSFTITKTWNDVLRAYVKYGKAILHIYKMFQHLQNNYADYEYEIEVSVDETESVTSPFEHFFFANELKRLGVKFISLAPRFVGDFEKGIDYKGDLELFKSEYKKHLAIVNFFGDYKISLHSGSDKFSIYEIIGALCNKCIHVKTAGTTYLEALKVVSIKDPSIFKKILEFSVGLYEIEKKSYHVSADITKIKDPYKYVDEELIGLFNSDDVRQILHVTFGRVLSEKTEDGQFLFKERIMKCLNENEELHYEILVNHFIRHLKPFYGKI